MSDTDTAHEDNHGVQAAKWLLDAQARHREQHGDSPSSTSTQAAIPKLPTIRDAAAKFNTSRSQVGRHFKALRETGLLAYSPRPRGRPRLPESETRRQRRKKRTPATTERPEGDPSSTAILNPTSYQLPPKPAIIPPRIAAADSPSIRAAKWLLDAQARHRELSGTSNGGTDPNTTKPPSIREAARLFNTSSSEVGRHAKCLRETGLPWVSARSTGRPRLIQDGEDDMIEAYARWLIESGWLVSRNLILDAATRLQARRDPSKRPIYKHWWGRWKKEHPWVELATTIKPVEAVALPAEELDGVFERFYGEYKESAEGGEEEAGEPEAGAS